MTLTPLHPGIQSMNQWYAFKSWCWCKLPWWAACWWARPTQWEVYYEWEGEWFPVDPDRAAMLMIEFDAEVRLV